jgi:hypothetical protein
MEQLFLGSALDKEQQFYSFNEKDVKGKYPNDVIRVYHLEFTCSKTITETCVSIAIDPKVPNQPPVYSGQKMCDWGFSVKVRVKFVVSLESYSGNEKVETVADHKDMLLGSISCVSNLPDK